MVRSEEQEQETDTIKLCNPPALQPQDLCAGQQLLYFQTNGYDTV